MKHLWLIVTSLVMIGSQSQAWAFEEKEEMDIEAEASMADATGSELNAAYLDEAKEQQKLDTLMDVAHAEKVVKNSKVQQAHSEALIGKAQAEIQVLKRQIAEAMARKVKAQRARKDASEKLSKTVRDLKAYRVRAKRADVLAMQEERENVVIRARTAKLQSMMLPAPQAVKRQPAKARPSQASAAAVKHQINR